MELTRDLSLQFPLLRGEDVRAVQLALLALKIQPLCGSADGVYGPTTRDAVMAFQRGRKSLKEDGAVGQLTWSALIGQATASDAPAPLLRSAALALTQDPPPLSQDQVRRAKAWLMTHFADPLRNAAATTPLDIDLICAIACQETAAKWLPWIDSQTPEAVLARCVFDASGDYPGTNRAAFPANTAAFRARYPALADSLIAEANQTRALQGWGPEQWVYKGYGIFQYDLQNIAADPAFFQDRQWYSFGQCLDRLMRQMSAKLRAANNNLADAVRRYNGGGAAAQAYAAHVLQMRQWAADPGVPATRIA